MYYSSTLQVPFGEVNYARDWLGITGEVRKPAKEHPKKQVWGLDCPRREVYTKPLLQQ